MKIPVSLYRSSESEIIFVSIGMEISFSAYFSAKEKSHRNLAESS